VGLWVVLLFLGFGLVGAPCVL